MAATAAKKKMNTSPFNNDTRFRLDEKDSHKGQANLSQNRGMHMGTTPQVWANIVPNRQKQKKGRQVLGKEERHLQHG